MDNRYDVIVIGAGNGGLAAAATMAKNGYKTLVLERHNLAGGCATSFVRGRFEFEAALHELCDVGYPEAERPVRKVFESVGAEVDWRFEHNCFRVINRGEDAYDVVVRGGWDGFLDSIEEAVPGSRESVEKLLRLGQMTRDAMAYMDSVTVPVKFFGEYADFVKAGCYTVDEVMNYLGVPQKAQNIINTYWSYLGIPTDEMNAMHFLSMVYSYIVDYAAMPKNRSNELSVSLSKSILDNGGDIWYNAEVTGLLFDDKGKVCGVKVGDKELYAEDVFSNAIPNNVYNMIEDQSRIPERMRKLANAREIGLSLATAYVGLDCTAEELGLNDYTVFVTNDSNPRRQEEMGEGFYIVNCLNVVIPDSSPEGTCTLFFSMPLFDRDFPRDLTVENYKKFKSDYVAKYIRDFEQLMGIDIRSHIEEIAIATPVTFARYLGTPKGAIYGYRTSGWDNVMMRSVFEPMDFTIKGLHFVGGHHTMGDGFSSSYITGKNAADALIKQYKKEGR